MSNTETPAPSFISALVGQRQQAAIGLVVAAVILATLSVWWGVWGFGRSGDAAAAKSPAGSVLPEEATEPTEPAKTDLKPKRSPDYQIACVWAGALALLALLSAVWVYTQPPDPAAPATSARVEVLVFGGCAGFITAMAGVFLGYRWHQSLVQWIGSGNDAEARWVLYAAAIFLAGLLIMFASLQLARTEQRANATLRRILYGFNSAFVGLLLLLILIAINIFAFIKVPKTLVTNKAAFVSLSDKSKDFLHSLDRPVHVYLIMNESHKESLGRVSYDTLYTDCRGFLSQCEDESRHFKVTYLSPAFDPVRIAALMERLKVNEADRDSHGLLATVGENEDVHTFIRAQELIDVDNRGSLVFQGENKLLTELIYLTDERQKEKIYFTQDHGELTIEAGQDRTKSATSVVQFLRERKLTVEPLTFDGPNAKVPDDAGVVVVAGLRRTLAPDDPMITALRAYLHRPEKPGKLLLFLPAFRDPANKVAATGLEELLREFGVDVDPDHRLMAVPRQINAPLDYVLVEPVSRMELEFARIVGRSPVILRDTRPVRPLQTASAGSMRASPIYSTNMSTWQEKDYQRQVQLILDELSKDEAIRHEKRLTNQRIPVGVVVSQSITGGDKPVSKPRMLVMGSETFLQDNPQVLAGVEEILQQLFSNMVDWLRERDTAMGIPPRKVEIFVLEKQIEWQSQFILLGLVTVAIAVLGGGVWLSRRR